MERERVKVSRKANLISAKSLLGRRIREALLLLEKAGMPVADLTLRKQEKVALALFSIANMKPDTPWSEAAIHGDGSNWRLTSREIINFENKYWKQRISSGSYDDIRRQDLERLLLAGIATASVANPNANRNDPTRRYAVSEAAGALIHNATTNKEDVFVKEFLSQNGSLAERLERRRPIRIEAKLPDGKLLELADGEHNRLQKAILEDFLSQFVRDPKVLYIADTSNKSLHVDPETIGELGLPAPSDDMLPDIVVLDRERSWVLLIEAVHSSNPISRERHLALEKFTESCRLPKIFVSVFATRTEFRKWAADISWETEVWLADSPSHMIHFNGDKFLGPYDSNRHG
jgi:hypothetical protein